MHENGILQKIVPCGLSPGSQPGVCGFIVIAELQFFPHKNRSYVYKIIFCLC